MYICCFIEVLRILYTYFYKAVLYHKGILILRYFYNIETYNIVVVDQATMNDYFFLYVDYVRFFVFS